MTNGKEFAPCCLENKRIVASRQKITEPCWKQCFGLLVQERPGETFLRNLVIGAECMRYDRWSKKGCWAAIFEMLATDKDLEYLMVDGSIARVHQHGAPKKTIRKNNLLENRAEDQVPKYMQPLTLRETR